MLSCWAAVSSRSAHCRRSKRTHLGPVGSATRVARPNTRSPAARIACRNVGVEVPQSGTRNGNPNEPSLWQTIIRQSGLSKIQKPLETSLPRMCCWPAISILRRKPFTSKKSRLPRTSVLLVSDFCFLLLPLSFRTEQADAFLPGSLLGAGRLAQRGISLRLLLPFDFCVSLGFLSISAWPPFSTRPSGAHRWSHALVIWFLEWAGHELHRSSRGTVLVLPSQPSQRGWKHYS